jgi:NTP pyrophosphatase (non-canonical NTP hydrolase)
MPTLNEIAERSHALSKAKGWWDGRLDPEDRSFVPEKLMLIVSEAAEALEAYRDPTQPLNFYRCTNNECDPLSGTYRPALSAVVFDARTRMGESCSFCGKTLKPEGVASELADIVICVGDLAARLGIDLGRAVEEKHAFNETRALRHGGKVC